MLPWIYRTPRTPVLAKQITRCTLHRANSLQLLYRFILFLHFDVKILRYQLKFRRPIRCLRTWYDCFGSDVAIVCNRTCFTERSNCSMKSDADENVVRLPYPIGLEGFRRVLKGLTSVRIHLFNNTYYFSFFYSPVERT